MRFNGNPSIILRTRLERFLLIVLAFLLFVLLRTYEWLAVVIVLVMPIMVAIYFSAVFIYAVILFMHSFDE